MSREKTDMRSWRNWQTRKTKDLVSPGHAGSIPVDRTKRIALESAILFLIKNGCPMGQPDKSECFLCAFAEAIPLQVP